MKIRNGISDWCDKYEAQLELLSLVMVASPLASVFNSADGMLSTDVVELALIPHACEMVLSTSQEDTQIIKPSTLIVWAISSKIPYWLLPNNPHPDILLGHLFVSLSGTVLKKRTDGTHLVHLVSISSNLQHIEHDSLQQIIKWLSKECNPSKLAIENVFRSWQKSGGSTN